MFSGQEPIIAAGLMSGTSGDGLDVALVEFQASNPWTYRILHAETVPYQGDLARFVEESIIADSERLLAFHFELGRFMGRELKRICRHTGIQPKIAGSHGHTVFHQPHRGFTFQAGHPGVLANVAGIPVCGDFRSQDVGLGGNGAPLVPIGDELLFPGFDACLNLGGIANISFRDEGRRRAYDVCVFNMGMNYLSEMEGKEFDKGGAMAEAGEELPDLLQALNSLEYFGRAFPKSLGREWFEQTMKPVLANEEIGVYDRLASFAAHCAEQVSLSVPAWCRKVLVTGGGAWNEHFLSLLNIRRPGIWHLPAKEVVDYKEALVFAFLGLLRARNEINVLAEVTGSSESHIAGCLYMP